MAEMQTSFERGESGGGSVSRVLREIRHYAGKLVGPILTILIASFVVFVALSLAPGDPAVLLLGGRGTPRQIAFVRHELGLDQPLLERYWDWLKGVVHGDFGTSISYRTNVSNLLWARAELTLSLVVYAAVIMSILGVGIGVVAGSKRTLGPIGAALAGLGVAVPGFIAAQLLVSAFALNLGWFPAIGAGSGFADKVWHLTLPAIALSIAGAAYIAQITMSAIQEETDREYVETAHGRGLSPRDVFRRHIFRNALLPITTVTGLTIAGLIAGAVVVEYAFGLGGLGSLLIQAVNTKDYAVVEAISLILVVVFVVVTAIVDGINTLLDPRLRKPGR